MMMMKKTTERLKRAKEIEESLEAGDVCFERLKNKKKSSLQFENLAHHKRTKTLFQALKEDDLTVKGNGTGV